MGLTIGITELSRHARRYLERVRAGETVTVTDRGELVAELRPLPPHEAPEAPEAPEGSVLARLIAEGRVRPARGSLIEYLKKHPPRPAQPGDPTLTEVLLQMRDEERA